MDIECKSRKQSPREQKTQKQSKFAKHIETGQLYTVPFGPTTIQTVCPLILDKYIELRYGKRSPCQYPFADGIAEEFSVRLPSSIDEATNVTEVVVRDIFQADRSQAEMNFALENWYVPKKQREEWWKQRGNQQQMVYTDQIPNLNKVEVDNSMSAGCRWGMNNTLKVIGWNAERGTFWNKFYGMVDSMDDIKEPHVILMNEMDIGMARSGNVHTVRRLAHKLGMNYAFGVEFLELTRGTREEQESTEGQRDALSLHGNAILTKCIIGESMILRDPLDHRYFSDKAHRGINANGYEVRLGGRMGLFARIFEQPVKTLDFEEGKLPTDEGYYNYLNRLPPHFVVGNVHKLGESKNNRKWLWNYYGFGHPPLNSTLYEGKGIDLPTQQKGVIIQGDFGPKFCALGGLTKVNKNSDKTFRVKCLPNGKANIGPLAADYFCTNMKSNHPVKVTPSCDWSNKNSPLTLADHAIVSTVVQGREDAARDIT